MQLAIVSETPSLFFSDALRIGNAIYRQLEEDYAPIWQSSGVPVKAFSTLAAVPKEWSLVTVLEDSDQANALGYHDVTPDGRPYAKVFARPILAAGGNVLAGSLSIAVTLSHEILETVGDPYASFWADTPDGDEEALELCDRVEGDSYEIDGVSVSNFLGPRAFSGTSPGPFDRLGRLSDAWDMTPGGYMIRRNGGPGGTVTQVFGELVPAWRREQLRSGSSRHAKRARFAKFWSEELAR